MISGGTNSKVENFNLFSSKVLKRVKKKLKELQRNRRVLMDSSSSLPLLDYLTLLLLRPFLAFSFVLSLLLLGWFLAWKLVLVHVPLVQEIFGLKNKSPTKPKPIEFGRFTGIYSKISESASSSS